MKGIKIKYHKTFLVKNGTVFYIWSTPPWWGWFKPKYLYKIHFTEAFHLTWKRLTPPICLCPDSSCIPFLTPFYCLLLFLSSLYQFQHELEEGGGNDSLVIFGLYTIERLPPQKINKEKKKHWNMKIRLIEINCLTVTPLYSKVELC